ncbi:MAG: hypothetical protein KDC81_02650 [Flavobacteriaceae bacterium]|nr:hypothetical protein [Flavobacteriaceae bacterium]
MIDIQNSRFNAIKDLIDFSNSPNVKTIIENDSMKASQGGRNFTFFPVVGSYKAASNTGLIDNIKDEQLKNNILNLYEHLYVRINYNGEINDNRYEMVDWESRNYIDYTKKELVFDKRGLLDKDFVNQLGFLNRFVRVYIGRCDDTKLAIETTLKEINNYLMVYD